MDFYNTMMGKRFYESTMPNLIKAIDALSSRTEYAKTILNPSVNAETEINAELSNGAHIVNITTIAPNQLLVIFSKSK